MGHLTKGIGVLCHPPLGKHLLCPGVHPAVPPNHEDPRLGGGALMHPAEPWHPLPRGPPPQWGESSQEGLGTGTGEIPARGRGHQYLFGGVRGQTNLTRAPAVNKAAATVVSQH